MFCNSCGAQINNDAKFCPVCGAVTPAGGGVGGGGGQAGGPGGVSPAGGFIPPTHVQVRIGDWISSGWEIVRADWFNFALCALLFLVISSVVPIILQGAMIVGLHIVCIRRMAGHRVDLNDFFRGFNYFVPSLVATILISIFIAIGTLLCIIPGLVVAAMYMFTYLFILDKKMDFWPAMQASHAIVKANYLQFTLLVVTLFLLHLAGVLACLVGLFITIPIQYAAITVAYKEIVGFTPGSAD